MAFEGSDCMVPHLRWLGLRNTQVYMKHTQGPICTIPTQCLDRLSPVDYRKIKTLKDSIRQRMQLQSVSGSGTSSEEFHPYIQELDLMHTGRLRYSIHQYILYIRTICTCIGGVKCELEALYTMGYNTVANLFEKCILSGDFI